MHADHNTIATFDTHIMTCANNKRIFRRLPEDPNFYDYYYFMMLQITTLQFKTLVILSYHLTISYRTRLIERIVRCDADDVMIPVFEVLA